MRRLLVLIAIALVVPAPADACTCGQLDRPTLESCRTAKRVFAGTVARYHWPTAYDRLIPLRAANGIELAIDRVWRGNVGASVVTRTGDGGGDCGIHPLPGTRFVVCDDREDDDAPDFALCSAPAFDAHELEAALGPAAEPGASLGGRLPWWREPMLVPLAVIAVFASIGRRVRRETTDSPLRYRSLLAGVIACAIATVAIRGIAHVLDLPRLAGLGPVALASCLGAWIGFRGQQRPRRFAGSFGGLAAAIAFAALPVAVGYLPPHVPWDRSDAVACSRRRAEAILASPEPLDDALARQPYACTDWGTARFRRLPDLPCLSFADGEGGRWEVCRLDETFSTFIGPEKPW